MDKFPIDVVITWVDGNDPAHRTKRKSFMTTDGHEESDDIGGDTRYISNGEILVCICSIFAFAPFIRKIFIVTDGQDPHIGPFIRKNFPDCRIPVEIVDHKVIFKDFEQYLPTFNSLSIETMLFRIPGLSEHFIYFNDDSFILRPVSADDWFEDGKAICFGKKFSTRIASILRAIKPMKDGHKPFGHKDAMLNAAIVAGESYFWHTPHAPLVLRKSWFEKYYSLYPEVMEHNIRFRFRNPVQFNPQSLFFICAEKEGLCVIRPEKGNTLFIKSRNGREGYMERKIKAADKSDGFTYGCINSIEQASIEDRKMFSAWISRRLQLKENIWE